MNINASPIWAAACLSLLPLTAATTSRADQTIMTAKPEKHYTGTVRTVDSQEHTVDLKGLMLTKRFNLGADCNYLLPDHNPGTINDLRPGEKIRVNYQDAHGVLVADRVEQVPVRVEGMVKAVDAVNHTLTIHRRALDKDFQVANECTVVLRDEHPGTLADIQVGDHVTVTYETPGEKSTARQIAQTSLAFTGSLTALDLHERTVKATGTFSTKKFILADHCAIVMNGKLDGRLEDLKPNDKLVFNYDEINGINIVNRIGPAPEPETPYKNSAMTTGPGMPGMGY
jgi:Cu/Ag efflux protein CusF